MICCLLLGLSLANAEKYRAFLLAHETDDAAKFITKNEDDEATGTGFGYLGTPAFVKDDNGLYMFYSVAPFRVPYTKRLFEVDGKKVGIPIIKDDAIQLESQERTTDYTAGFTLETNTAKNKINMKYLGVLVHPQTTDERNETLIGSDEPYDYTDNYVMSACDPTVVKYKGYYYMFYAGNKDRYNNVIIASRSASLRVPFAIWSKDSTWRVNSTNPAPVVQSLGKLSSAIEDSLNYVPLSTITLPDNLMKCDSTLGLYRIPGSPYADLCFDIAKAYKKTGESGYIKSKWNQKIADTESLTKGKVISTDKAKETWTPVPFAYPIRGDRFEDSFHYGSGEPAALVYRDNLYVFYWTTVFDYGKDWRQQLGFWEIFYNPGTDPNYDDVTKQMQLAYIKYDGITFSDPINTGVFAAWPMGQVKLDSNEQNICVYSVPKFQYTDTTDKMVWHKTPTIERNCFDPNDLLNQKVSLELKEGSGTTEFTLSAVDGIEKYNAPKRTDNDDCGVKPFIQSFDILSDMEGHEIEPRTYAVTLYPERKESSPQCVRGQSWIITKDTDLNGKMKKSSVVHLSVQSLFQQADHSK